MINKSLGSKSVKFVFSAQAEEAITVFEAQPPNTLYASHQLAVFDDFCVTNNLATSFCLKPFASTATIYEIEV